MSQRLKKILHIVKQYFNIVLMAISPIALLMLIVAFIMLLDTYGAHQRLGEALEEVPQTTTATITGCYEEERYCFADLIDTEGQIRYGKLDWRYYPEDIRTRLAALERGDTILVRFAQQEYENEIVLAEYYDTFTSYKGYLVEIGGIALVSWVILILHPEIMLFSLVDNLNQIFDAKWKRMTKPL